MSWFTEDDLEEESKAARRLFGIGDQRQPDMATVIFKAQHHGVISAYRRTPGTAFGGSFNPRTRVLELTEATFCGLNQIPPQADARVVIAHELGHAWLGHERVRNFTRIHEASNKVVRSDEWQVEYFGLAFLIPFTLTNYHPNLSAQQIGNSFNVPIEFSKRRTSALKRIFERSAAVARPLPKAALDLLASNKAFLRTPCSSCGKPTVVRIGIEKICESCGAEN